MYTHRESPAVSAFIEEAVRYPELSDKEIRCLAEHRNGDGTVTDTLIRHHLLIVLSVARSFAGGELVLEERIAEGMRGLMKAAESYSPTRGAPFHSYARLCVKRDIIKATELRELWDERQGKPFGAGGKDGRSLWQTQCHNNKSSRPEYLEAFVQSRAYLPPDWLAVAREELEAAERGVQLVVDCARRWCARTHYRTFIIRYGIGDSLVIVPMWHVELYGVQSRASVCRRLAAVWSTLKRRVEYAGGDRQFKADLERLLVLSELADYPIYLETEG